MYIRIEVELGILQHQVDRVQIAQRKGVESQEVVKK